MRSASRRWLRGRSPWQQAAVVLGLAVLAAALAVGGIALVRDRAGAEEPVRAGGFEVDPARVAELEAAEAERAAANLETAGDFATDALERLLPVMDGLHAVLPTDGSTRTPPGRDDVGAWRDVVEQVQAEAQDLPTGSSEHNIVRNGLGLSTGLLGDAVDAVELARTADAARAERMYGLAADLRTRAVEAWSVAAIQLDLQYVAADQGHLHVFLPVHSGGPTDGSAVLPGHDDH